MVPNSSATVSVGLLVLVVLIARLSQEEEVREKKHRSALVMN